MASDDIRPKQIKGRVAAAMKQMLDDVRRDPELVVRSFKEQLAALGLPPRPVIFYPNLRAASEWIDRIATAADHRGDPAFRCAWVNCWNAFWGSRNAKSKEDWFVETAEGYTPVHRTAWGAAWDATRDERPSIKASGGWALGPLGFPGTTIQARSLLAAHLLVIARDADRAGDPPIVSSADSSLITAAIVSSQAFLEALRGGSLFFWVRPDAIHVVLATIHTWIAPSQADGFASAEQAMSRLHRENGPAIEYEDGSGLYCWKGIQVPGHVILHPDQLRVDMILSERNAEVRRVMIERYGQDRFVLDANAKILDTWNDNELLSVELPNDPDRRLLALRLRCPSTAAVYIIRVPPDQLSVRGALAWSFGLEREDDYVLRQES